MFTSYRFVVVDSGGHVVERYETREAADKAARLKAEMSTWRDYYVAEMKPLLHLIARTRIELEEKAITE